MSDCCDVAVDSDKKETALGNQPAQLHIVIVGTGSAAFAAAIQAVENGARVTMIEAADVIGGTCVNIGCVPSKIMLRGAHIAYLQAHHGFDGIARNTPLIDRKQMLAQQQSWVEKLRFSKYENILQNSPDINLIKGSAEFKNPTTLRIRKNDNTEIEIKADKFLIAVGSRPFIPEISGLSSTPYWTSTEALVAEEIPQHVIVLGGSVVAIELAQSFRHLGARVTLMARSTLLSKEDEAIGEELKTVFEKEEIDVQLHTVPLSVVYDNEQFVVSTRQGEFTADKLLLATGRQSNADTLCMHSAGVKITSSSTIVTDDHMQTAAEHIYAAGDCTAQPQFVYVAAAAGNRAARNMTGDDVAINLSVVPKVVFTSPQVASVGLTEQQAEAKNIDIETRTIALEHVPRAIAAMDTRGFIKLIAEKHSGRIIGCHIVANEGGEIIQTAALAISNNLTIEDLANQLFPYLTMVEGLKLCAQTFNKDVSQLSCCAG